MNHHPSRQPDDDPEGDAAVARVNRLRAARGKPPIVERDPALVRCELIDDRDATTIALWALRFDGVGTPAAIDAATAGFGPEVIDLLPTAVAVAIRDRTLPAHQPAVIAAIDEVLEHFEATDGGRLLAELAVYRIADAVRESLADSIAAEGSDAIDHATGEPVPEPIDQLAAAADFAAGIVYADLIDRLAAELVAMAGLP